MFIYNDDVAYCVNCDWLQFSVSIDNFESPEVYCPAGCNIELLPGNNIFSNRLICTRVADGAKLFTMLWHPYSRVLASDLATVQISNYVLYADGIQTVWRLVQETLPCRFNSIGRLDVCCDFVVGDYELMRLRQLSTGDAYVQRKREGSVFWHKSDDADNNTAHCMSWGSKTSEIKVKVYNKSREIGVIDDIAACTKPYILDIWRQAGFDIKKVWRLEFSLCSGGMLRWDNKPISLDDVCCGGWLVKLFVDLYFSRFVTRLRGLGTVGHHNCDVRFYLLKLKEDVHLLRWADPQQIQPATTESITMLRKVMGLLEMPICSANPDIFESTASTVFRLCENQATRAYFKFCFGGEPEDVLQQMYDRTGEGMFVTEPKLSRTYT